MAENQWVTGSESARDVDNLARTRPQITGAGIARIVIGELTLDSLQQLFADWQDRGIELNAPPHILAELFLGLFVSDVHADAISHRVGMYNSLERLRARTQFFVMGSGVLENKNANISFEGSNGL